MNPTSPLEKDFLPNFGAVRASISSFYRNLKKYTKYQQDRISLLEFKIAELEDYLRRMDCRIFDLEDKEPETKQHRLHGMRELIKKIRPTI